jgi:hypothetical protein
MEELFIHNKTPGVFYIFVSPDLLMYSTMPKALGAHYSVKSYWNWKSIPYPPKIRNQRALPLVDSKSLFDACCNTTAIWLQYGCNIDAKPIKY